MSRYKFKEDEVPYAILEQFGLTQEMIEDLPAARKDAPSAPVPASSWSAMQMTKPTSCSTLAWSTAT